MQDKHSIANALRETAQLLKAKGENKFKVKAYISAAKVIDTTDEDIDALVKEERLTELPGVGQAIAAFITELYNTDETTTLKNLRQELPVGTAELSKVEGLTLKRIQTLNDELDITTLKDLEQALLAGKIAKLKGFNDSLQKDLLKAIQHVSDSENEMRLQKAWTVASDLTEFLSSKLPDYEFAVAGAVRAWAETVAKLELVANSPVPELAAVIERFPGLVKFSTTEDTVNLIVLNAAPIEVLCVKNLVLGLLSKPDGSDHYSKLQTIANAKGYQLNTSTFSRGKKTLAVKTEADVYKTLGLHVVPPEIRQGLDEIDLAENDNFEDLLEIDDIRGMTHCHTTFSDGIHSVEEMAQAAQDMGLEYVTITDHSPTAHYAGGLPLDKLKRQWEEIDRVQEKLKIRILKGTECDILSDGRLDYPDNILEKFDLIIASIHSRYKQNEELMTRRVLAALQNPHFKIWGHPLGRILLSRDPIPVNVPAILEAVKDASLAIEINGDPHRMDLPSAWSKLANELGFRFIVSTDAHSTGNYNNLTYGIHLARRAGIRKSRVLNTQSVNAFLKAVRPVPL